MKVEEKHAEHFGLFLGRNREEKSNGMMASVLFDYVCVRWLKNFESPFISLQLINKEIEDESKQYKILIRRVMWDSSIEEQLLDDPGALKLLYLQVSFLYTKSKCLAQTFSGVKRCSTQLRRSLVIHQGRACKVIGTK